MSHCVDRAKKVSKLRLHMLCVHLPKYTMFIVIFRVVRPFKVHLRLPFQNLREDPLRFVQQLSERTNTNNSCYDL